MKGQGDTSKLWVDFLRCAKTREQPLCNVAMAVRVQAPLSMGIISHREAVQKGPPSFAPRPQVLTSDPGYREDRRLSPRRDGWVVG